MGGTKYHQVFLGLVFKSTCSQISSYYVYICLSILAVPNLHLVPPGGMYVANEGSNFSLQCIADVYPVTSLMWVRILGNGNQGMADVCMYFVAYNHCMHNYNIFAETVTSSTTSSVNLTYPCISSRNDGTYSCVARTSFNMANITAAIFVRSKNFSQYVYTCTIYYSLINIWSFFVKGNCPEELASTLTWPSTQPGQSVMQPCFPNTTSTNLTATRTCDSNGNWMAPNTSDCTNGNYI